MTPNQTQAATVAVIIELNAEDQAAEQADMAAKAARLRQLMGDDEGDEECLFPNA